MNIAVTYSEAANWKDNYPEDNAGRDPEGKLHPAVIALRGMGHEVTLVDMTPGAFDRLRDLKPDAVFNLCDDGFNGNATMEPHVVALLEMLGLPYTGCGPKALTICLDKAFTKSILAGAGLPTPRFYIAKGVEDIKDFGCPVIVKPLREDGSIGIKHDSVASNKDELAKLIKRVTTTYRQPALVEEFISGREFNVAILGKKDPVVLPISEIKFEGLPEKERIVSYEAKWIEDSPYFKGTVPECPAKIDEPLAKELREISKKAYALLELKGYGRVDIRVGADGPRILEVNPNPDIDSDAGFPRCAKAAGMDYDRLIARILEIGLER